MSYNNIKAARAKRTKQEANKEAQSTGKRGRPKHIVVEAGAEATVDKGTREKPKRAP